MAARIFFSTNIPYILGAFRLPLFGDPELATLHGLQRVLKFLGEVRVS